MNCRPDLSSEDMRTGDSPRPIVLSDEFMGYSHKDFLLSPLYRDYIEGILIPNGMIKDRLEKMAVDILYSAVRRGVTQLTLLCVLRGAYKFASDLSEKLEYAIAASDQKLAIRIAFITANTYVNDKVGHETKLQVCGNPELLRNQDLLIVEDLLDTGTTLTTLLEFLGQFTPRSIELACLLVKRCPQQKCTKPNYIGFEVPNRFIVGYAIDYNDHFRGLPHICVVNEEGKKRFRVEK